MPHRRLLDVVEKALRGGVDVLQLWATGQKESKPLELAKKLLDLANGYNAPLIINNDIQLAKEVEAHGVHMDRYNVVPADVRKALGEQSVIGYTVGNDLERVKWAETVGADYVSFCAVFPTTSVTQCEVIPLNTVRLAKSLTHLPVFASGGINLSNAHLVLETGADGIAVISSILKAQNPEKAAESFKEIMNKYRDKIK
ncbi:MAG: thiamine phosphate synthase [Candidatus Bathyarchaeota archaeon]|nr:MAG: thiamine phosphate synthase [Candidatus Bathyarchaeota archaeon]